MKKQERLEQKRAVAAPKRLAKQQLKLKEAIEWKNADKERRE